MIYLASVSPRRQELLRQLGIAFEAVPSNLPEVPQAGERPEDYVLRVARAKAQHVARQVRERGLSSHPVLGADTEVVLEGEIIGRGRNSSIRLHDPTAHAEVLAMREAAGRLGNYRLPGCTLYATVEPCAMCAGAAVLARVERLVYGCEDPKAGAVRSLYQLADDARLNHQVEVRSGVLAEECGGVLRAFFRERREKGD